MSLEQRVLRYVESGDVKYTTVSRAYDITQEKSRQDLARWFSKFYSELLSWEQKQRDNIEELRQIVENGSARQLNREMDVLLRSESTQLKLFKEI